MTDKETQRDYFLVYWYKTGGGREDGWDLVWAANALEAKAKYRREHYSPISRVLSRTYDKALAIKEAKQHPESHWETFSRFEGITQKELDRARQGEVVEIESGT